MAKKTKSKFKGAIIGGSVILCLIIIAFIRLSGNEETVKPNSENSNNDSSIANSANTVETLPGTSDRKSYNDLQDKENQKNVKKAIEDGNTSIPVLTKQDVDNKNDPFNDLNLNQIKPQLKEETPVIDTTPPAPLPEPVVQQAPQVVQQPVSAPIQNTYNYGERGDQRQKVEAQLMGYLNQWKPSVASQERDYTGQDIEKISANTSTVSSNSLTNVSSVQGNGGATLVRAGTIIPGVLISGLNSDTPGPVLAQIVSGKLKGARLMGEMKASDSGIVIQFTKLSMIGQPKTFEINAYAIDPNTTSTSLASDVNNHYFLRYGLGLAAAFVSGYGEAVSNQGTTTTVGAMGNVTQTQGNLDNAQITKSAFGKVGQKLGSEIDKDSNKAPTVTVNAGSPLGILVMSDL
jgi:type IV secretory pathway VirB10-like protein